MSLKRTDDGRIVGLAEGRVSGANGMFRRMRDRQGRHVWVLSLGALGRHTAVIRFQPEIGVYMMEPRPPVNYGANTLADAAELIGELNHGGRSA